MHKITHTFTKGWIIFSTLIYFSCSNSDQEYFIGNIISIEDTVETIKITPTEIKLDGIYYGWPAVYDSVMLFCNWKLSDYFYNAFNLKTGEHLGDFCPRGEGPLETLGVSPISQFYQDNGELKTLLLAPNNLKLLEWNISRSIAQKTTVNDSVISYDWSKEHLSVYLNLAKLNDKDLLAYVPSAVITLDRKESNPPFYERRTIYTDELVKSYPIYTKTIHNINSERFFASTDAVKSDGSMVVQAMRYVHQINIINLNTGNVTGYRMKVSPDFSSFLSESKAIKQLDIPTYYVDVQADDKYIYALYSDGKTNDTKRPHIVHVYNWNGKFVKKLDLQGEIVLHLCLDPVNNLLYTTNEETDNIYCYNLNDTFN